MSNTSFISLSMRFLHDSVIVILFMTLLSEFIDIRLLSLYTGYWCNGEHTFQKYGSVVLFFSISFLCSVDLFLDTLEICPIFVMCIIYIISTRETRPGHRFFNYVYHLYY